MRNCPLFRKRPALALDTVARARTNINGTIYPHPRTLIGVSPVVFHGGTKLWYWENCPQSTVTVWAYPREDEQESQSVPLSVENRFPGAEQVKEPALGRPKAYIVLPLT